MPISQPTRNFLAYLFGTLTVVFGTILLVALATGWQYDFTTGELRDTGLIIMSSEPQGATIKLNGKTLEQKTPYRATNSLPGLYSIQYEKAGYRPWLKQASVEAERVSFADYVWLLPEQIPYRVRYPDARITAATQSSDRRRFAFVETIPGSSTAEPTTYKLSYTDDLTRLPKTLATAAPVAATSPITSLDSLSLNADGGWVLARQVDVANSVTWWLTPTNPDQADRRLNLSTELASLGAAPSWISWSDSEANDLYFIINGSLRRWQINEKRLSQPLADGVLAAKWSDRHLVTVEVLSDGLRWLRVRQRDRLAEPETLSQVASSPTYQLDYFQLLGTDYAAVLPSQSKQLSITRGVFSNIQARVTSISGSSVTNFTVNRSGRYVVMNQSDRMVTIDLERNTRSRFGASLAGLTSWEWMNDQHLAIIAKNQLRLIDFDGQNNELISATVSPTALILFADNKSLLSFVLPGGVESARARLTHFFLLPDKILE